MSVSLFVKHEHSILDLKVKKRGHINNSVKIVSTFSTGRLNGLPVYKQK